MWRSKRPAEALRAAAGALERLAGVLVRGARLSVGIPDYAHYVEHVRRHHPQVEPMNPEAFFRNRMQARYGRGRSRCC